MRKESQAPPLNPPPGAEWLWTAMAKPRLTYGHPLVTVGRSSVLFLKTKINS